MSENCLGERALRAAGGMVRAVRKRWSRGRPGRRRMRSLVYGTALFVAAVATVLALAPGEMKSAWHSVFGNGGDGWGELVIERPVGLTDGEARQTYNGDRASWIRSTAPQIDLIIRNRGNHRVALGRARIEITDSERITACELPQGGGGGEIPVTEAYFVDLPLLPSPDERVVYRRLHQEVLPGQTTRLKLYFRSFDNNLADDLFAVNVSLVGGEAGQVLHVGRFLFSLPETVPRASSYLPASTDSLETAAKLHTLLPTTWCFRRNLAAVHRFLSLPGKRSPAMRALSLVEPPRRWRRLADRRSPAEAAAPLLRSNEFFIGPLLALYAARQANDPALLGQTRQQATGALRRDVEGYLAHKF